MKKTLAVVLASAFTLSLAACGSTTDASEDASADNVEIPADEAMAGAPAPVEDPDALAEAADAAEGDAMDAAATAEDMVASDSPEAATVTEAAE